MKFFLLSLGSIAAVFLPASATTAAKRPNILIILADDMGYSDLGCYGSEIETPQLDQLASEGIRLTNFRVNPMCTVTRTSLLTGHTYSQSDHYKRSLPLPKALREKGYMSSISGKWHQPNHPMDHGFDHFYGFLEGQINNFTGSNRIMRQRKKEPVPKGWFATDDFTTHTIQSIDKAMAADKPFFAYLSFNAPHTPLHVAKDLVDKYKGRFDTGWHALRQQRFKKLKQLGLIDDSYVLNPTAADVRKWRELPEKQRKLEAFRMQTYAAVVDNLDQNVGRVLSHLKDKGLDENTIVIFLSDNGGDYSNGNIRTDHLQPPWEPNTLPYMSNGWAALKCTPFRFYKTSCYEGALRVPFIMRWPKSLGHENGTILKHQTHVTDLYPTLLELAGTSYTPAEDQAPLHGKSLVPLLKTKDYPLEKNLHPVFWALEDTTRGYLDYPWKIVSTSEGPWQLFNLAKHPTEQRNLKNQHPDQVIRLAKAWRNFAENETPMPPLWKGQLTNKQHGFGMHRLRKIWGLRDSSPAVSASNVGVQPDISFTFDRPLNFKNTKGKTLRLYRVQEPNKPVWKFDPEPDHPAQGKKTIVFDNIPTLLPNSTYFMETDIGWARSGPRVLHRLNDGAYWFRFRTKAE